MSPSDYAIRPAGPGDRDTIVEFNLRLAWESEGKTLDREVLRRGVERALNEAGRLRYWIAEVDKTPVGQAATSLEWSDWRDGWLWWLQSVYVVPEHRGRGVFKALFRQIRSEAQNAGNVAGLRLYVEQTNFPAHRVYERIGMKPGGYFVLEDLWS